MPDAPIRPVIRPVVTPTQFMPAPRLVLPPARPKTAAPHNGSDDTTPGSSQALSNRGRLVLPPKATGSSACGRIVPVHLREPSPPGSEAGEFEEPLQESTEGAPIPAQLDPASTPCAGATSTCGTDFDTKAPGSAEEPTVEPDSSSSQTQPVGGQPSPLSSGRLQPPNALSTPLAPSMLPLLRAAITSRVLKAGVAKQFPQLALLARSNALPVAAIASAATTVAAGAMGPGEGTLVPAPKRIQVWSIFVGNIAFDTTEEEVNDLFRALPGFRSFRLAAQLIKGGSRGYGFAEFDDAACALGAIKNLEGNDVRGRRLRLRWGESVPTTPEVDEFHQTPERFKTRPCYEMLRGSECPRGENCPYAHSEGEMRYPSDAQRAARDPDRTEESVKVLVPSDDFEGATDEEKQRAAYSAVLGTGASNIRFIMRKTGCRLQLRGTGDRGIGAKPAAEGQEPLHIVVRPSVGCVTVTEDQIDLVRKMVDEIVKHGKPSDLDAGNLCQLKGAPKDDGNERDVAATSTTEPQGGAATSIGSGGGSQSSHFARWAKGQPCAMGSACPNVECRFMHPRLPGLHPCLTETAKMQMFVVRSDTLKNIQTSVRMGIWATSKLNTQILHEAWEKFDHVVLIFSVNNSGHFQGYARIASAPSQDLHPGLWGRMSNRLGSNFKVSWLKQCMLPFSQTDGLRNGLNNHLQLRKSRDGQEVPCELGEILVRLMYQQHDEDLVLLRADTERTDDELEVIDGRSRSPLRSHSRQRHSRSGSLCSRCSQSALRSCHSQSRNRDREFNRTDHDREPSSRSHKRAHDHGASATFEDECVGKQVSEEAPAVPSLGDMDIAAALDDSAQEDDEKVSMGDENAMETDGKVKESSENAKEVDVHVQAATEEVREDEKGKDNVKANVEEEAEEEGKVNVDDFVLNEEKQPDEEEEEAEEEGKVMDDIVLSEEKQSDEDDEALENMLKSIECNAKNGDHRAEQSRDEANNHEEENEAKMPAWVKKPADLWTLSASAWPEPDVMGAVPHDTRDPYWCPPACGPHGSPSPPPGWPPPYGHAPPAWNQGFYPPPPPPPPPGPYGPSPPMCGPCRPPQGSSSLGLFPEAGLPQRDPPPMNWLGTRPKLPKQWHTSPPSPPLL